MLFPAPISDSSLSAGMEHLRGIVDVCSDIEPVGWQEGYSSLGVEREGETGHHLKIELLT